MRKKNISCIAIIKIAIGVGLMILAVYANFIAIRRISRYAIEVNLYNKFSVAYDIGGIGGLKSELAKIKTHDKLRHELAVAAEFEKKLDSLKDPGSFIDHTLSEGNKKIMLLINLRRLAIALIIGLLMLRIFVNLKSMKTKKVYP